MNLKIESLAYYLPQRSLSASEVLQPLPSHLQFPMTDLTGIEAVRKVEVGEYAIQLAMKAIERCLSLSTYDLSAIDMVIACNICPYDKANTLIHDPSTAAQIIAHFGFPNARGFDINNACAGVFTGLYVAQDLVKTGAARNVLVFSGEFITVLAETVYKELAADYATPHSPNEMMACMTLCDSAVAMIVDKSETKGIGFEDIKMQTLSEYSDLCIGIATPNGPIMLTKSAQLALVALKNSAPHLVNLLQEHQWQDQPINHIITHQTAEKAMMVGLGLANKMLEKEVFTPQNIINNLKKRGNSSTTTHFVATMDYILNDKIQNFDKIAYSVSASGLTIGSALYNMDDLPERVRQNVKSLKQNKANSNKNQPFTNCYLPYKATYFPSEHSKLDNDTFVLIREVLHDILRQREAQQDTQPIGHILFTGVYRSHFLSEPAIAAMILKESGLSEACIKKHFSSKIFAFDLKNGALGTQNAIEIAHTLLQKNTQEAVLVLSAEVQHSEHNYPIFPLQVGASAIVVSTVPSVATASHRLLSSQYFSFPEHIATSEIAVVWAAKKAKLKYEENPNLINLYLDSIAKALENVNLNDYEMVLLPAISSEFMKAFKTRFLAQIPHLRFVATSQKEMTFTNTIATALETVTKGQKTLLVQVGAGIQVNLSEYE